MLKISNILRTVQSYSCTVAGKLEYKRIYVCTYVTYRYAELRRNKLCLTQPNRTKELESKRVCPVGDWLIARTVSWIDIVRGRVYAWPEKIYTNYTGMIGFYTIKSKNRVNMRKKQQIDFELLILTKRYRRTKTDIGVSIGSLLTYDKYPNVWCMYTYRTYVLHRDKYLVQTFSAYLNFPTFCFTYA